MPVAMTYTSLIDDVRLNIERGSATYDPSVSEYIPKAINLTERRIARELKIQGFQSYVVFMMKPSLGVYQKPNLWRETISVNVGTNISTATTFNERVNLRELAYEAAIAYWPNRTTTGTPRFYSDYGYSALLITPTPAVGNPCELAFWGLPPQLDDTTQTNYLTEFAPNALLHGTLDEMFGYLRNDADKAKWKTEYDRDMAALNGEDLQKIIDRNYKRQTS